VIINNLDVVGIAAAPGETDTPLVVDSNAIAPRTVAPKHFQAVPGWGTKVLKPHRPVQEQQLPAGRPFNRLKTANGLVVKQRSRFRTSEGPNQLTVYDV
jgi:hypothetical protein